MKPRKPLGRVSAIALADYILKHYGPMSHLKLQKLLYYCEAYHLAYFQESLVPEEFEAWVHGPVCREVYHGLKGASILYSDIHFDGTRNPDAEIYDRLNESQIELINDVLDELSSWRSFELENATHKESPWITARAGYGPADRSERVISKNLMADYYRKELDLQ